MYHESFLCTCTNLHDAESDEDSTIDLLLQTTLYFAFYSKAIEDLTDASLVRYVILCFGLAYILDGSSLIRTSWS